MKRYRRIEITAFRRRVTIVSGEWRADTSDVQPAQTDEGVCCDDADPTEAMELESAEGQLILVEAVRLLQRKLINKSHGTEPCTNIPAARRSRTSPVSICSKLRALRDFITRPSSRPFPRKEK